MLAVLNCIDVHAFTHLLEGDEPSHVENCQTCEDFVVSTYKEIGILPHFTASPIFQLIFRKEFTTYSSISIVINQEKYLGKFHNKPPPSLA